ncbi:hypothetical protein B7494_g2783 [Chlorociboria aeruginascens]|nr:hypothetical protein B7494_g2783 [Chlorociboria aeruginascens]
MDMIRYCFALLKWRGAQAKSLVLEVLPFRKSSLESPPSRKPSLEVSPFRKLPLELILHISSYLPPESGATLALTCYALYSCLEMQCLPPLKKAECSVVNRFLHLLDRDLPGHLLCPHCNKFHSMSLAETHLPSRQQSLASQPRLACWKADSEDYVSVVIHDRFSSTIFRMAMKAHRQGHDTANFTNLLSNREENPFRVGFRELHSATARIQDGSLLVRNQTVFMIPSSKKLPLPWSIRIRICNHIRFGLPSQLYKDGIQIPHSDAIETYENKQGIIYCEHCHTEFRIDFKSYGEDGNAMFVTTWIDLGDGRDPDDFKWKSRVHYCVEGMKEKSNSPRGSIYAAFEQKVDSDFKCDSLLTAQDEKYLRTKSRWSWPEDIELSHEERIRQYHYVREGRFIRVDGYFQAITDDGGHHYLF